MQKNIIYTAPIFMLICFIYPGFTGTSVLRIIDIIVISLPAILIIISKPTKIPKFSAYVLLVFIAIFTTQMTSILLSHSSKSILLDLTEIYKLLLYATMFFYGNMIASKIDQGTICRTITLIFIFVVAISAIQLASGPSFIYYLFSGRQTDAIDTQFTARVIGTLGNPNYLAVFCIAIFYFYLNFFFNQKRKIYLIYMITAFMLLLFTQSRSSLIYFFLFFFFFIILIFIFQKVNFKNKLKFYAITILISIIIFFILLAASENPKLQYLFGGLLKVMDSGLESQSSFAGRLTMWNYYFNLIIERPYIGHGPSKNYFLYSVADNNYIFILFKYGIIGLILTLSLWILIIIKVLRIHFRKNISYSMIPFSLGIVILLASFTAEMMESLRLTPFFFLLSGLAIKHSQMNNQI